MTTESKNAVTILIPADAGLADLCRIRFEWETQEPYQTSPSQWEELARRFWRHAAVANAQRCEQKAAYYRKLNQQAAF